MITKFGLVRTNIFGDVNVEGSCCFKPIWIQIRGLTASLPIYNRTVDILLEAVTLKPLLRWVLNLSRFYHPWEARKAVMSLNFVTKTISSVKNPSLLRLCMYFLLPHSIRWSNIKLDLEVSDTYQITWELRTSEPFFELNLAGQQLKKTTK